ncbi:hypothetical protein [Halomicrobium zhouii]|nr:hypothetical protein [Halomicrobium zhouii]
MLEAPAWMVKELDSGHVMVVKTDNPVDPTTRPSVSTDSYLLEGKSREVLEEDQQDIADPFLHLDNGALGTDVVIHRENVEGNLTNDDIQLVRVKVEEDALWELDSGEFLRRRIDHQGDPIGDLPDKIGVDEEPYPPLIRLNVPPEFVELDAPTDENVVTKVLEMDIEISKLKILANLAGAVSDAEDLAAIEPLVDQLHKLDDVSGIEQVIEERIL